MTAAATRGHPCGNGSLLANFSSSRSRNSPREISALCASTYGSLRERIGTCNLPHDLTRNDARDLILFWMQAGRIRSPVFDFPDSTFSRAPHRRSTEPPSRWSLGIRNCCKTSDVLFKVPLRTEHLSFFLCPWNSAL